MRSAVQVCPSPPSPGGFFGGVAQLGEHLLCTQGVAGSIPVASTPRVGGLIRGLLLLTLIGCATSKERTGLVLGDDRKILLIDDEGARVRLQLTGEARALENLLGCRVTVSGTRSGGQLRVSKWVVKDSGYGSEPHVGRLERLGGAWRMNDRNSGALIEFLAESLGPLSNHEGDLVLVDGIVIGPHLVQVVSYRILVDQ